MSISKRPRSVKALDVNKHVSPVFTPWRVTLLEVRNMFEPSKAYPIVYYVRESDPVKAAVMAERAWDYVKTKKHGKLAPYPRLADRALTEQIAEKEWRDEWRIAQKFPHTRKGPESNPLLFRFFTDEREKATELGKAGTQEMKAEDIIQKGE